MDSIIDFLEPLLTLLVTIVVIIMVFVLVVKPLFHSLIIGSQTAARKKMNRDIREAQMLKYADKEEIVPLEKFSVPESDNAAEPPPSGTSQQEQLAKLAQSDPDKAANLVKNWTHEE